MTAPAVFLVGMPRSGTTLLAGMLSASALAVSPETHYYGNYRRFAERRDVTARPEVFRRYVAAFFGGPEVAAFGLSPGERQELLLEVVEGAASHRRVLATLLDHYAVARGKVRWAEKTPGHVFHLAEIFSDFPEARIVHLVRDPRDVALSLARVGWEPGNLVSHLRKWRRCLAAVDRCRDQRPRAVSELRYEDLLEDPEAALRRLCEFLELEYEPAMLQHHRLDELPFDPRAEPWKRKVREPLDRANHGKWRVLMTPRQRRLASRLAGRELAARGYEVEPGRWSPLLVLTRAVHELAAGADIARHLVRRALRRLRRDSGGAGGVASSSTTRGDRA